MYQNLLRQYATTTGQWLKRQRPLVVNSVMFAGFLTAGDYLAIQLEQKLNEKPKHHPVHRSSLQALADKSSAALELPKHFHHHHQHQHNQHNQQQQKQEIADSALALVNPSSSSNDGGLLHKLGCVFKSGAIIGVLNHYWYVLLDGRLHSTAGKIVALKVLLDQLVASNLTNAGFFVTCGLFEGKTPEQCASELKAKYLFLYMSDIIFWVPAQAINFRYVPAKYRVAFVSVATMAWNVFLCYHRNNDLQAILLKPKERQQQQVHHLHTA